MPHRYLTCLLLLGILERIVWVAAGGVINEDDATIAIESNLARNLASQLDVRPE
jgi:hypothetical protein